MSDIQDLEREIVAAKELIGRRNMAHKLSENHEFRVLFHEGFFVEEAARLVQLSADPSLSIEQRADALSMAQATGHTKRYLSMMFQMGAVAERELPQMEASVEELRAMGMEDYE